MMTTTTLILLPYDPLRSMVELFSHYYLVMHNTIQHSQYYILLTMHSNNVMYVVLLYDYVIFYLFLRVKQIE